MREMRDFVNRLDTRFFSYMNARLGPVRPRIMAQLEDAAIGTIHSY